MVIIIIITASIGLIKEPSLKRMIAQMLPTPFLIKKKKKLSCTVPKAILYWYFDHTKFIHSFFHLIFIYSLMLFFLFCTALQWHHVIKIKGFQKNSTASVPTLRKHIFWWWIRYIYIDWIKKQINKNNALTRNAILGVWDNIW